MNMAPDLKEKPGIYSKIQIMFQELEFIKIIYSTEHKYIEKLTVTTQQPFYNVFFYFEERLEPNYVQRS